MYLIKSVFLLFALITFNANAQFNLESFLNEPFDKNYSQVKSLLADKKFEEKEVMNLKGITYFTWIDPISIKVGYMFSNDNKQKGIAVSNSKDDESDAVIAFDIFKNALIKKYGNNFSENSMMGMTLITWKGLDNLTVMLTTKDVKTMLTVIVD